MIIMFIKLIIMIPVCMLEIMELTLIALGGFGLVNIGANYHSVIKYEYIGYNQMSIRIT